MQYLELFDTASHARGRRQEGHPVVNKTLQQYSSLTLLKKECYEEEVQTDYIYNHAIYERSFMVGLPLVNLYSVGESLHL